MIFAVIRSFGYEYRSIIFQLIRREIVGRYRGSAFGLLWSLLTPLFMLGVYTFVFGLMFRRSWDVPGAENAQHSIAEFSIILFSGLLAFQFFAELVNKAPGLILANVNYVKKIVFPLHILPVVAAGAALFHAAVSLLVLLVFVFAVFGAIPPTVLLAPLVFAPLAILVLGLAWFLAALGVYFRDVSQIISPLVTATMFLSPIFFPLSAMPEWLQPWMYLNPLTVPVESFRAVVIFGVQPDWLALGAYAFVALMVAVLGLQFFQMTRRGFADVL